VRSEGPCGRAGHATYGGVTDVDAGGSDRRFASRATPNVVPNRLFGTQGYVGVAG